MQPHFKDAGTQCTLLTSSVPTSTPIKRGKDPSLPKRKVEEKKKKTKDLAGFESMTIAPPSPALVRSANPDQCCWMPFFANFIYIPSSICPLTLPS